MSGWIGAGVVALALVVTAWRESQREKARQTARMYDGSRGRDQWAEARLTYFARTAPDSEITAAVRLWESVELDRAAAQVVAEMAAQAAEESERRKAAEEEGAA